MPPYSVNRQLSIVAALIIALLVSACAPFWSHKAPRSTPATSRVNISCPAWSVSGAPLPQPPAANASPLTVAQYNAALVLNTPRPVRDLYILAARLGEHAGTPISCQETTTYTPEKVGQKHSFYIINANQIGYHTIQATLRYVTPHLYMYVQDGASVDPALLTQAANRFESVSYVTDRRYFGNQWPTGPDGDPHITVLNVTGISAGGYFSSEDEYPRTIYPYSNQRQMIVDNLDSAKPGEDYYDATLAHEFQHMIHWYLHPTDPSWTNEGMSVLAQHLNGLSTGGVDIVFLQHPETMLGGWTDDDTANVAHYGAGYLFMAYYLQHYGSSGALQSLLRDPRQVPLNFDHALQASGNSERFDDVFADWVLANALDNPAVDGGKYAYGAITGMKAQAQHSIANFPYTDGTQAQPATTSQYAAEYYDFRPQPGPAGTLRITLRGQPVVGIVDNTPYQAAPAEWWSNSGNDMDTTLTRAFDLTSLAGKTATLTFNAWYNLEQDSDYVYVEASTDGGHTWKTLPASSSTTTNPNGANYGQGITGISGGGAAPVWIPERVNLSAYAGQRVLLRFESITDDAVHMPGFTLDNVSIPELGYHDGVSSAGGWMSNGWLRTNNVLPEHYVLQAVVYSNDSAVPTVQRIPVDVASGTATTTVTGFGSSVREVLVAVSAMAPGTVVHARYVLSASLG